MATAGKVVVSIVVIVEVTVAAAVVPGQQYGLAKEQNPKEMDEYK